MAWQRISNRIVPPDWHRRKHATWARYGDICHACGHRGATEIDHVLAVAHGGTHDLENLRPIHGDRCPTCSQRCHIDKTTVESHAHRPRRQRPAGKHPGLL